MPSLKKIILYNKLFKFKFYFYNLKILFTNFFLFTTIKLFKILINIQNYGIFIPTCFNIQSTWIFSFWKPGFISNFLFLKWFYINTIYIKSLPTFFINLTSKTEITNEISKKKIPFINIFKKDSFHDSKNVGDYFFKNAGFLIHTDLIYFYLKTFIFLKKYKNV